MKTYYQKFYQPVDKKECDLPIGEYFRFFKLWDVIAIASDAFTLSATAEIVFVLRVRIKYVLLQTTNRHLVD